MRRRRSSGRSSSDSEGSGGRGRGGGDRRRGGGGPLCAYHCEAAWPASLRSGPRQGPPPPGGSATEKEGPPGKADRGKDVWSHAEKAGNGRAAPRDAQPCQTWRRDEEGGWTTLFLCGRARDGTAPPTPMQDVSAQRPQHRPDPSRQATHTIHGQATCVLAGLSERSIVSGRDFSQESR